MHTVRREPDAKGVLQRADGSEGTAVPALTDNARRPGDHGGRILVVQPRAIPLKAHGGADTCAEPDEAHIIFESMCKTDRQDSAKLAEYARDTRPENWVTIPVPSVDESAERELINMYVNFREDRTKSINRLHAVFNSQGLPTTGRKRGRLMR